MKQKHLLTVTTVFLSLLLVLIACFRSSKTPEIKKFASINLNISSEIVEGEVLLTAQNLEFLGVMSKQGSVVPVAKETVSGTVKMGFVALTPVKGEVASLVFRSLGNNPQVTVSSAKGTLPSRSREEIEVTTNGLQVLSYNPLASHDAETLTGDFLAKTQSLSRQNITSQITPEASFVNFPLGDINQNSDIDFEDAIEALSIHYGVTDSPPSDYQLYHADVNCSGKVEFDNAIDILLKLYELIPSAKLVVCPKKLVLESGQTAIVLAGNAGKGILPNINLSGSTGVISDVSGTQAVGKAYKVTAPSGGLNGNVKFDAGAAGSVDISVLVFEPTGGPEFLINSPLDGAAVGGAVFFAVQPQDSSEVAHVYFDADGVELAVDAPGENAFRVFLLPEDFPEGPLELTARVIGTNAKQSKKSITIDIVNNPPETATVTANGAILSTQEQNGAISTLSIPADCGVGTNVSFEARTKQQVKAATGVDYDAAGVTFLGAQEIDSSAPLNCALGVSSGGFGPMVQPGQAVVNYMIAPDGDGDGVGELTVVNTASVAPNGDVVSDPVPQAQIGANATVGSLGTQSLRTLATDLSGPPGAILEIEVSGFNPNSPFGNIATFTSSVDNSVYESTGSIAVDSESGQQTFITIIPPLPPGPATLVLTNETTGFQTSIQLDIQTPQNLPKPAPQIINEALSSYINYIISLEVQAGFPNSSILSKGRGTMLQALHKGKGLFAELAEDNSLEAQQILTAIATMVLGSNDVDSLGGLSLSPSFVPGHALCFKPADRRKWQRYSQDWIDSFLGPAKVIRFFAPAHPKIAALAAEFAGIGRLLREEAYYLNKTIDDCSEYPDDPGPPDPPDPPDSDGDPDDGGEGSGPGSDPSGGGGGCSPSSGGGGGITGMGAVPPAGGNGCGGASGPPSGGLGAQSLSTTGLFDNLDLTGRYTVKAFVSGLPFVFSGITDAGGYFFIPLIPEGQPFTAVAFDNITGQNRTFEGVGPAVGESTFMFFDFFPENTPPVANINANQSVSVGNTVNLSAANSSDADEDFLVYTWSIESKPAGSNANLSSTDTEETSFIPDIEGAYQLKLIASDFLDEDAATITITVSNEPINNPPVANAGDNQIVAKDSNVSLDASASTDPDGDTLSYTWTLTSQPNDSTTTLSVTNTATTSFIADKAGTYEATVTVSDGELSSTDTVTITVINNPPVANAGNNSSVIKGDTVNLDGSASTDPDGDALIYTWELTTKPTSSNSSLSSTNTATTSFVTDLVGTYIVTLGVNDGEFSDEDTLFIIANELSSNNNAPIANAGSNQSVVTGIEVITVNLDGSASFDPDGDVISFAWTFSSKPSASSATLLNANTATPSFIADVVGTYNLTLSVSDGEVTSTDDVIITASAVGTNSPPVANGGGNQTVTVGNTVTLDGSASFDPDIRDFLTLTWELTSKPLGSSANISARSGSEVVFFIADLAGEYKAVLTATDDSLATDVDEVTIIANNIANNPPVANAGNNQSVNEGDTVDLDGSASTDPDGDTLVYTWVLASKPDGSNTNLTSINTAATTFEADKAGSYVAVLTVSDGELSDTDSLTINASELPNNPPIASAGDSQIVFKGNTVQLDGSDSSDPDGDTLSYNWSLTSTPIGSNTSLSEADTAIPSFVADLVGEYQVNLSVSDGELNDDSTVIITVNDITQISYDTEVEGILDTAFNSAFYTFQGAAGDHVSIALEFFDGGLLFSVREAPYDPSGPVIATSTQKVFTLPNTNDYIIEVHGSSFQGLYTLRLNKQTPIDINTEVEGIFASSNTPMVHIFQSTAGDLINIGTFNGSFRIFFRVSDSAGNIIGGPNNYDQHAYTDQMFTFPDNEIYIIEVFGIAGYDYTLGLAKVEEPQNIDVGTNLNIETSGNFSIVGETKFFRFNGNQNDFYNFVLQVDSSPLKAHLEISPPRSSVFYNRSPVKFVTVEGDNTIGMEGLALLQSGEYILRVKQYAFAHTISELKGSWQIVLQTRTPTQMTMNNEFSQSIGSNDFQIYQFSGQAGDLVNITTMGSWQGSGKLHEANVYYGQDYYNASNGLYGQRSFISRGPNYRETGIFPLAGSGTHHIVLYSRDQSSTGYTLGIAQIEEPQAVDINTPISTSIDILGDIQFYSFNASASDVHNFFLSHPAGEALNATLKVQGLLNGGILYLPTLASATTSTSVRSQQTGNVTFSNAGEYVIQVGGNPGSGLEQLKGAYEVTTQTP